MLSTSPWHIDCASLQSSSLFSADLDITTFGNELDNIPAESEGDLFSSVLPTQTTACSVESSVASSDCTSEDLYSDVTSVHSDFHSSLQPLRESLTSPFMCILDEPFSSTPENGTFYWSDSELDVRSDLLSIQSDLHPDQGSEGMVPSVSSSPRRSRAKHKRKRSHSSRSHAKEKEVDDKGRPCRRPLSSGERLSLIQDLTETVSHSLGLREQLEVTHIINPQSTITDTQLVIDLQNVDDEKLQKVRDFICSLRRDRPSRLSTGHVISDSCSECTASNRHPEAKRLTKKQRQELIRKERQRQRKEERQQAKEERSGLFTREEVMSISGSLPEQSAEVDILS